ncbi:C2H2-like zinc finger protein [Euphorbia peplus]|nr:C2H2-like zinc finger protein [Euphorbia peplus]
MPVAKLTASSNTDLMKTEEGNDSLDTFIRQAIGKEPFLSFSRAGDSPVQWIQLLHALDQQDLPGWPLLTPLKVQMQKCDKCSREFCSSINYRRHIRVHHRLKKLDKDSAKNRDLLGIFWDKLSEDETKELLSFRDVSLEEVSGSSIIKSLMALIRRPGLSSLPQYCLRAGAVLLDIIQARPSRFPMSSEELFSILDDASEKTFLSGTAVSMQKYIFDGEAGKIGLETKNLIACTCFLVEQKLVKAWLADKDAEALRCQKLLVEEEEAAQRRQAELLERKRQKKLRQKEQKAKELRQGEADLNERIDDTLEAVPLADLSCPLTISDSNMQGLESTSDQILSTPEPLHPPSSDEDVDLEIQTGTGYGYSDSGTGHNIERQRVQRNSRRNAAARWHLSPKSQWNHMQNGFHTNQNSQAPKLSTGQKHGTQRDLKSVSAMSGTRKWSRKAKTDYNGDSLKTRSQKQTVSQSDENKKHELLIGSISVTLGNCSHQECDNFNGAREDCISEHPIPRKHNLQDKQNRTDASHYSSNRSTTKQWIPKKNGMKETVPVEHRPRESQVDENSCKANDDNVPSSENCSSSSSNCLPAEGIQFSCQAAKAFLAERWKEAISKEHVRLVLSSEVKASECDGIQSTVVLSQSSDIKKGSLIGNGESQLVDAGAFESSTAGAGKAKFRTKPEKGVKLKGSSFTEGLLSENQSNKEGVRAAAPHLFLLSCQVYLEGVVFSDKFAIPIHVFVPVFYNSKRIFSIVEWLVSEFSDVKEGSGRRVQIGRGLALANMAFWGYNLFGFLLPVYLPRAFSKYYSIFSSKVKD